LWTRDGSILGPSILTQAIDPVAARRTHAISAGAADPASVYIRPDGTVRRNPACAPRRALARMNASLRLIAVFAGLLLCSCRPDSTPPELDALAQRRHLGMEGAANFRDLGGYPTEDGRSVRWELLYRSDDLSSLTEADLEKMSGLGIRLVCDFRGTDERNDSPDRLPTPDPPSVAELEISDASWSLGAIREKLSSADFDARDSRRILIDANRDFATRFAPQYAAMFARISNPENLPALVHCTAGKDRAGFASALILRVLGVPMDRVYEDYLLTNAYTFEQTERTLFWIKVLSLNFFDPEKIRPLFGVERAYLDAAFDEIARGWGSFDDYRREALKFSDAETERFREQALEPAEGSIRSGRL